MRYVYLVRAGENKYKIGVSRNVQKRIAALQTSNIHLVELVCAKRTTIDSHIEKQLHKKVREFSGTGGKEWFHLSPEQAIEIAIEISKAPEIDIAENIIQDLKREMSRIIDTYETRITEEIKLLEAQRQTFANERIAQPKQPIEKSTISPKDREALQREADEHDYQVAKEIVLANNHASTSFLQRRMRIGYGKAARLMERMEADSIISPLVGIHRTVL
jgi:DNA segregation ATPase FtsK/SpoIIIE-like protein